MVLHLVHALDGLSDEGHFAAEKSDGGSIGEACLVELGRWFEVMWRSSLLDLFTIYVPPRN